MYHRNIKDLDKLGAEIMYNDQITGESISAIVGKIEKVDAHTTFVYTVSPYDDENTHIDNGFRFRDIIVFDDRPDTEHGWHKNAIEAAAKNPLNR